MTDTQKCVHCGVLLDSETLAVLPPFEDDGYCFHDVPAKNPGTSLVGWQHLDGILLP